jgi:hypothetical protein
MQQSGSSGREEFKIVENEAVHEPTSARWTAYPGIPEPHMENLGHLGDVLKDGNHYWPEEVRQIARQLPTERLQRE